MSSIIFIVSFSHPLSVVDSFWNCYFIFQSLYSFFNLLVQKRNPCPGFEPPTSQASASIIWCLNPQDHQKIPVLFFKCWSFIINCFQILIYNYHCYPQLLSHESGLRVFCLINSWQPKHCHEFFSKENSKYCLLSITYFILKATMSKVALNEVINFTSG